MTGALSVTVMSLLLLPVKVVVGAIARTCTVKVAVAVWPLLAVTVYVKVWVYPAKQGSAVAVKVPESPVSHGVGPVAGTPHAAASAALAVYEAVAEVPLVEDQA